MVTVSGSTSMMVLTPLPFPIRMPARLSHRGQKSVPLSHRPAASRLPVRLHNRRVVNPNGVFAAGGTAPAVLNAANEVAVAAFLAGTIGFLAIEELVADALDHVAVAPLDSLATVHAADAAARARVAARIAEGGA